MNKTFKLPVIIALFSGCIARGFMKETPLHDPLFWCLFGGTLLMVIYWVIEDFSFHLFVFRRFTDRKLKEADKLLKSDLESTWGSSAYSSFGVYNMQLGSFPRLYGWWRFWVDRVIFEGFFPERKDRPFPKGDLPKLEEKPSKYDFRDYLKDDIALLKKLRKETQKEDLKSRIDVSHLIEILFKGEWGYWKGTYGTK